MHRRGNKLHHGRCHELRSVETRHPFFHLLGEALVQIGSQQRRHVERSKDGQAITQRKESVRSHRNSPGHYTRRSKHAHEDLVLVDANTDVCSARGGEFRGSGRDARGRLVVDGREGCVDGIGGEICSAVKAENERCWLREEDGMRAGNKRFER